MSRVPWPVFVVTLLLIINCGLSVAGGPLWLMTTISAAGPFLILWMVIHTLRTAAPDVRDLGPNEDWGYQDRPDLRPGA